MVEASNDPGLAIGATTKKGRGGVQFLGIVSLGNLLILAGMVCTGLLGIYEVGGIVQHMQDALSQEISDRTASIKALSDQIAGLSKQEDRDISTVTAALTDIKQDVRLLTAASVPGGSRRP